MHWAPHVLTAPTGSDSGIWGLQGMCVRVGQKHWARTAESGVRCADACHSAAGLLLPELYL